ncbi:MAG: four-helix bundle copper-binding protein [Anaerolinea sp.]|nr:four-helix bundle copper-binding protein [Anaerolinea sp.]
MLYEMLESHKRGADSRELDPLTECVKACFECAEYCTICADACLSEDMVADLRYCIRTDLDCADICLATGRMAARQTKPSREIMRAQLQACMTACRVCAEECERHADHHEHCRLCAQACRRCENACQGLLTIVPQ